MLLQLKSWLKQAITFTMLQAVLFLLAVALAQECPMSTITRRQMQWLEDENMCVTTCDGFNGFPKDLVCDEGILRKKADKVFVDLNVGKDYPSVVLVADVSQDSDYFQKGCPEDEQISIDDCKDYLDDQAKTNWVKRFNDEMNISTGELDERREPKDGATYRILGECGVTFGLYSSKYDKHTNYLMYNNYVFEEQPETMSKRRATEYKRNKWRNEPDIILPKSTVKDDSEKRMNLRICYYEDDGAELMVPTDHERAMLPEGVLRLDRLGEIAEAYPPCYVMESEPMDVDCFYLDDEDDVDICEEGHYIIGGRCRDGPICDKSLIHEYGSNSEEGIFKGEMPANTPRCYIMLENGLDDCGGSKLFMDVNNGCTYSKPSNVHECGYFDCPDGMILKKERNIFCGYEECSDTKMEHVLSCCQEEPEGRDQSVQTYATKYFYTEGDCTDVAEPKDLELMTSKKCLDAYFGLQYLCKTDRGGCVRDDLGDLELSYDNAICSVPGAILCARKSGTCEDVVDSKRDCKKALEVNPSLCEETLYKEKCCRTCSTHKHVEVAQPRKQCVDCTCYRWDGSNYSSCRKTTLQRPCNGYCVKCEVDGTTPMFGGWTQHAARCKEYAGEEETALAAVQEFLGNNNWLLCAAVIALSGVAGYKYGRQNKETADYVEGNYEAIEMQ